MPDKLLPTPAQTVGPFFSFGLCYEGDSQLVPPGSANAIRLHGVVYDGAGHPLPDALLEIRQADADGAIPVVAGSLHRDGHTFTGWGRCGTDPAGHYSFTTLLPGPVAAEAPRFFAVTVFARGLLDRLFTRCYLPQDAALHDSDEVLAALEPERRATLIAEQDGPSSLRFDVHLQGAGETVFLQFPRHADIA
ncbi:protocatechuate 3,4-dioxygenase subunit alpha [Rudaeicoccus suwonensis]|uniref:Protocatechuate 3,4-dioxygenase alpha subunit n=1 Tax=Rudaeicoccus suwonensis TaxID=657409 RepID=A0A561E6Y6_9MICO|nr:protocatechuate 3,4-dioxygenase subunit alpha [Rudaeicoccus suwonensis]TWE11364.1 protocatechuate 3,4-dioxygenase alpha subunit [Rudaeicoccus suwonensis]